MSIVNTVVRHVVANPSKHLEEINNQVPANLVTATGAPVKLKAIFSIMSAMGSDYYLVEGSIVRDAGVLEIWKGWLKLKLTGRTFAHTTIGVTEEIKQLPPADSIYKIVDKLGSCIKEGADYEWTYSLFLAIYGKIHEHIHNVEECLLPLRISESLVPVFGILMMIKDGELSKDAMISFRNGLLSGKSTDRSLYHKLFSLNRKVSDLVYGIACYDSIPAQADPEKAEAFEEKKKEYRAAVVATARAIGHSYVSLADSRGYGIRNILSLTYNEVRFKEAPFDL